MDYEAIANGVLIVLTGLLTYFGFRRGKKAEEQAPVAEQPKLAIAGALIDSAKADEVIKANDRVVISNASLEAAIRENTVAQSKNTDALNDDRRQLGGVSDNLRDLTLELARSGK